MRKKEEEEQDPRPKCAIKGPDHPNKAAELSQRGPEQDKSTISGWDQGLLVKGYFGFS